MTNSIRSPSEILETVVNLIKSPGDSNVQPGLRTTGLMEKTQQTKGNMKSFLNSLYIALKLYLCVLLFQRGKRKWYTKCTVVALILRQILNPVRKHTSLWVLKENREPWSLQHDLPRVRCQMTHTPSDEVTGVVGR